MAVEKTHIQGPHTSTVPRLFMSGGQRVIHVNSGLTANTTGTVHQHSTKK